MSSVATLAEDLGSSKPTVRRAINIGMIHAKRESARKVHVSVGEMVYLRDHWKLLSAIRGALRSEPAVERAILFGSVARGSDSPGSDLDIGVVFRAPSGSQTLDLQLRLSKRLGRAVQIVDMRRLPARSRLRREISRDGRTLIERSMEGKL